MFGDDDLRAMDAKTERPTVNQRLAALEQDVALLRDRVATLETEAEEREEAERTARRRELGME